jgi:hypothetical protein
LKHVLVFKHVKLFRIQKTHLPYLIPLQNIYLQFRYIRRASGFSKPAR